MADACFSSSLDNFGLGAYFLVCKHHQKNRGHMLTTEISRLCRPVRPVCTNRSDRLRWLCQNANWTSPVCSSRRDDRNAYVERLIWSSDERVMASERIDTGSDRSKLYNPSLELYFDADSWWGKTSPPYKYKWSRPIEHIQSIKTYQSRPRLVSKKILQYSSHRIFRHMHEVLNVVKK